MGVPLEVGIKYPLIIHLIYTDKSRGMHNSIAIQHNTNMRNTAIFIIEEGQITSLNFCQKINHRSLFCLLPGISF